MDKKEASAIIREKFEYYIEHPKQAKSKDWIESDLEENSDDEFIPLDDFAPGDDALSNITLVPVSIFEEFSDMEMISIAYKSILGREASRQEIKHYSNLIHDGAVSRNDIISIFSESPEGRLKRVEIIGKKIVDYKELLNHRGSDFVIHAYAQLLDRIPSKTKIVELTNELSDENITKEDIIENIRRSEEFSKRGKSVIGSSYVYVSELIDGTDEECVAKIFRTVLGREADPQSLMDNVEQLRTGNLTREQLILVCSSTLEGQSVGIQIKEMPFGVELPNRKNKLLKQKSNSLLEEKRTKEALRYQNVFGRFDDMQTKTYEDINSLKGQVSNTKRAIRKLYDNQKKMEESEAYFQYGMKVVSEVTDAKIEELNREIRELKNIIGSYESIIQKLEEKL